MLSIKICLLEIVIQDSTKNKNMPDKPRLLFSQDLKNIIHEIDRNSVNQNVYNDEYFIIEKLSIHRIKYINNLTPMNVNAIGVYGILHGRIQLQLDGKNVTLKQGDIIFVNNDVVVDQITLMSDNVIITGLSVKKNYLSHIYNYEVPNLFENPHLFFSQNLKHEEWEIFRSLINILINLSMLKTLDHTKSINSIYLSAFNFIRSLYEREIIMDVTYSKRHAQITKDFVSLVNKYYKMEHTLSFYSAKLCITPHYLGIVVKKTTGITPKVHIDRMLLAHIQQDLKYTNKTIKDILP